MSQRLILAALLLTLSACASWRGPTALDWPDEKPSAIALDDVPFFSQTDAYCGPAALASVLGHAGVAADPDDLVDWLFLPERQGTLQAELQSQARQRGLIVYHPSPSLEAVLAEVVAGRPVIVLENQGWPRRPVWHYAVITGFDLDRGVLIQHSGADESATLPLRRWQRQWRWAGQWSMALVKPGDLPAGDRVDAWIRALADFEASVDQGAHADALHASWVATTERWHNAPMAWFGLGNSAAANNDDTLARRAFQQSLALAPDHAPARYNLAHLAVRDDDPCQAHELIEPLLDHPELGPRAAQLARTIADQKGRSCEPHPLPSNQK